MGRLETDTTYLSMPKALRRGVVGAMAPGHMGGIFVVDFLAIGIDAPDVWKGFVETAIARIDRTRSSS